METVLNSISFCGTLVVSLMILYLAQNYTLGLIPVFNKIMIFRIFYLKDIIFITIGILLLISFTTFHLPY